MGRGYLYRRKRDFYGYAFGRNGKSNKTRRLAALVAGTIDAARIDTESLRTLLLTAENIEALTLNVKQGTIGGWTIDDTSIYRGKKTDSPAAFTDNMYDMTVGSMGLRGRKWRLDADGTGACCRRKYLVGYGGQRAFLVVRFGILAGRDRRRRATGP